MKPIAQLVVSLAAIAAAEGQVAAINAAATKAPRWFSSLPMTTGVLSALDPVSFGARYKPNQRKRRKMARRLGRHPANRLR